MLNISRRWVRSIVDQTNKGAEKNVPWFKTYRPPIHEGWCYLGQSLDSSWALLIKSNAIEGTEGALPALAPLSDTDVIQENLTSGATDWEAFWKLRPADTDNYVVLGDYYNSRPSDYIAPDLSQSPLNLMRAVRKDLCVKTTLAEEAVSLFFLPLPLRSLAYDFFRSTGPTRTLLIVNGSAFGRPYVPLSSFSHVNALNVLP